MRLNQLEPNLSGLLRLDKADIVYSNIDGELWRLPVCKLRVIGEYTTAAGPSLDDYFFVFITNEAETWHQASFYADGRDEVVSGLSKLLGEEISPGLCNSTHWKTRVLWPKALEGAEFFTFTPEATAASILARLRQRILPRGILNLSKQVLEAVNQKKS